MIQLGSYALGRHGFFYPDGSIITIPAAGTGSVAGASSRTNKPDPTDPLYIDLGACDDWQDDIKSSGDEKIWKPSPGRRTRSPNCPNGRRAKCWRRKRNCSDFM